MAPWQTARVAFLGLCFIIMVVPAASPQGIDESIAVLKSKSVTVKTDDAGAVIAVNPARAQQLHDEDLKLIAQFTSLKRLNLEDNLITDKGFQQLKPLQHIEELYCSSTLITDDSLARIGKWGKLRVLQLPNAITDEGLKSLPELPRLEKFMCRSPRLTDDSIDVLLRWRELRTVDLGEGITPAGYERLATLPNIDFVVLHPSMDDSIMAVLTKFPKLRQLGLEGTRVTEAGLPHLRRMHKIHDLILPVGTADEGLQHVAHMRELERLQLFKTAVTNEGIRALRDIKSLHTLTLPPTTGDDCLPMFAENGSHMAYLALHGKGYTDKCVDSLIALKWLTNLVLVNTRISQKGLERLKAAQPSLRLEAN